MIRGFLIPALVVAIFLAIWHTSTSAQTIQVTGLSDELADNGDCSLREAVLVAHGGVHADCSASGNTSPFRINLPAGIIQFQIAGTDEDQSLTGDLDIHAAIDLVGLGPSVSIIDAGGLDRVADVYTGGRLGLIRATVRAGRAPDGDRHQGSGGCVRANDSSRVVIVKARLEDCRAGDGPDVASGGGGRGGRGGGFFGGNSAGFGWDNGSVVISDSVLQANFGGNGGDSADGGGGQGGDGGAVALTGGEMIIVNSTIDGNGSGSGGLGTSGSRFDGNGGGISLASSLEAVVDGVMISNNSAGPPGDANGSGGGIRVSGTLMALHGSTLQGNEATFGGAISVVSTSEPMVAVVNSTITDNQADYGSALNVVNGHAVLASVTLTNNTGLQSAVRTSGSLNSPDVTLVNSIIAANAPDDCQGNVTSGGFNLVGDGGGCPSDATGDQTTTDPDLGALQDNGGPTLTRLPNPGSPAIDRGDAETASVVTSGMSDEVFKEMFAKFVIVCDQKRAQRPHDYSALPAPPGDRSDMGSAELGSPEVRIFSDRYAIVVPDTSTFETCP